MVITAVVLSVTSYLLVTSDNTDWTGYIFGITAFFCWLVVPANPGKIGWIICSFSILVIQLIRLYQIRKRKVNKLLANQDFRKYQLLKTLKGE